MTPQMTRSLFENLHALGKNLAQSEKLDSAVLAKIARPERFPAIFGPLFKLFLRTPLAHTYFDSMLKENGVYDKRFNQPFI